MKLPRTAEEWSFVWGRKEMWVDRYPTRTAAIKAAIEAHIAEGTFPNCIDVCQIVTPTITEFAEDARDYLETAYERAYEDERGWEGMASGWPTTPTEEAIKEFGEFVESWATRHGLQPDFDWSPVIEEIDREEATKIARELGLAWEEESKKQ